MNEAVFLSASIPDPNRDRRFAQTSDSVAIASAVSALLYVTLGRRPLVWGGHPAITPMVVAMCEAVDVDYNKWVCLYQSTYFEGRFPDENEHFDNVKYVEAAPDGSPEESLRRMRIDMLRENQFDTGVFIGGMEGILEEWQLFTELQPDAAVLPIASTGGAALMLAQKLDKATGRFATDLEYIGLFHDELAISEREKRYREPSEQPATKQERQDSRFEQHD